MAREAVSSNTVSSRRQEMEGSRITSMGSRPTTASSSDEKQETWNSAAHETCTSTHLDI